MNLYTESDYVLLFYDEDLESVGLHKIWLDDDTEQPLGVHINPVTVASYDLDGLEHLARQLLRLVQHARNRELNTVRGFAREKEIPLLVFDSENYPQFEDSF